MICSRCKQDKAPSDFGRDKRRPCGLKSRCRFCENEETKAYYARMKEMGAHTVILDRGRERNEKRLRERLAAGLCRVCGKPSVEGVTFCAEHRAKHNAKMRIARELYRLQEFGEPGMGKCKVCGKVAHKTHRGWRTCDECRSEDKVRARQKASLRKYAQSLKDEAYAAYGGYRCACCGETNPKFLTLDHINGGGAKHRRRVGTRGQNQLLASLKRQGFPRIIQILCYNCNCGRYRNGGICPHKDQF